MPFSSSRRAGYKISSCLLGLAVLVSGCGSIPREQAKEPQIKDEKAAELAELFQDFSLGTAAPPPAVAKESSRPNLDIPPELADELVEVPDLTAPPLPGPNFVAPIRVFDWQVIDGGLIGNAITGLVQVRFQRPVAVAVRGDFVYVVDAGLDAVFRYDRVSTRLEKVVDLKAVTQGEVRDIYVAPDFSMYLADMTAGQVLWLDDNGRVRQVFKNRLNLAKPVGLVVENNGGLVVADGHYDQLVRFNGAGQLTMAYGGRGAGSGEFVNVTSLARGPDGYYVGARVGRKLQVLSAEGMYLYSFEEQKITFPSSIVVDSSNRAYVGDYADDLIKVFDRGRLIGTLGGHGSAPGQFKRIEDLWLEDQSLYVVDSLNGRIQIARMAAERSGVLPPR
jgi:hypothetical protein